MISPMDSKLENMSLVDHSLEVGEHATGQFVDIHKGNRALLDTGIMTEFARFVLYSLPIVCFIVVGRLCEGLGIFMR